MTPSARARLMVVDDNRANRVLLEHQLGGEGFEVVAASGGPEALAMLKDTLAGNLAHHPVDLVLLDIMMPEIDGFEVLRRIRERKSPADLPIVMATAKDQTDDFVQALKAGANDYVVKPINFPVLLARIETQLSLKSARQALKSAQESLIQTAKTESIGFLAAGVAHEIRNPLARIQMGLESLQRNEVVRANEKLNKAVTSTKAACDKADEVVGELMKLAAESRPNVQSFDIYTAIEDALVVVQGQADSQCIEVVLEGDSAVPPARYGLAEMRQVLVNVLLNAVQAMPDGGTLIIRTGLHTIESLPTEIGGRSGNVPRRGEEMIAIVIADTGPGLPEDKHLTAFDAFYTTKATGTATGLGLTIAKKLIDLQGGFISLANREGGGAQVTILLPQSGAFRTTV